MTQYLTTEEAAKYLNVSAQYLTIGRHRGNGPRYHKLGNLVRYACHDLDAFMQERTYENTTQYKLDRMENAHA